MYKRELGISRREWRILAYLARTPDASLGPTASARSRRLTEGVSALPVGAVPDPSGLPAGQRY